MELDRKAFHFDLDNESVKRFYTGKRNAWSDIQDFLESHSFEKPQYSGYESAENIVMSYQRAYGTIDEMMYKFPWFQKCVKAATFTEIGESYDVKEFLENGMQLSLPLRPDTRKELHFDLGMAAFSENYGSIRPNAWRGAWTLIRIFMERNGFVHTQFSGYESKTVMAIDRAMAVMEELQKRYPWFKDSLLAASLTEVDDRPDGGQLRLERIGGVLLSHHGQNLDTSRPVGAQPFSHGFLRHPEKGRDRRAAVPPRRAALPLAVSSRRRTKRFQP